MLKFRHVQLRNCGFDCLRCLELTLSTINLLNQRKRRRIQIVPVVIRNWCCSFDMFSYETVVWLSSLSCAMALKLTSKGLETFSSCLLYTCESAYYNSNWTLNVLSIKVSSDTRWIDGVNVYSVWSQSVICIWPLFFFLIFFLFFFSLFLFQGC